MKPHTLQKIKEEMEAQEKQDYRNAMKSKMKERVEAKPLPQFAKVNTKNVIECQICKFSTKDQPTFMSHVNTKKHQSALEQLNRIQAQQQARAAEAFAKAEAQKSLNSKRSATYDISQDDLRDDEDKNSRPTAQKGAALVAYDDDDEEEEENVGPRPLPQPAQNREEEYKTTDIVGPSEPQIMNEEVDREENKEDEMIVEKPSNLPAGFFDKKEGIVEVAKKAGMDKTMQSYKEFMNEIKMTSGEDADEILKEIQGEVAPLKEEEQEMLEKVIRQDEEEIEDAQDYISNLRKRFAGKGKPAATGINTEIVDSKGKEDKKKARRGSKMEDEDSDDGAGFTWKKRSLF